MYMAFCNGPQPNCIEPVVTIVEDEKVKVKKK